MSTTRYVWYGLAFGIVLFPFGLVTAGVGHGSYLPSMIFAAPFSFFPFFGLFAVPPFWGVMGWLLGRPRRRAAIVTLSVHTLAAALLLFSGMSSSERSDSNVWAGLTVYAVGLLVAWMVAIKPTSSDQSSDDY